MVTRIFVGGHAFVGDHLWWTRIFGVAFFLFEDLLFECVLLFEELFLLMGYFFDGDTHFCGGHAFSRGAFLGFANLRSFVSRPTTSVVKLVILSHGFW